LPYATVQIVGQDGGVVTNEHGEFEINHVGKGRHRLRVRAMGYRTEEREVVLDSEKPVETNFALGEEAFVTDEVVVSANRNEVSRKEAPVVVNVMSTKLFEMVNSTDLAKSLDYQSGLRVENNCQNCGFPQVRINGLEGPYCRY
jgi:outer membrane receptor for ferrienterochelin and colicins